MSTTWEYKVLSLKPEKTKFFSITNLPSDEEASRIINREGERGWELVNTVSVGTGMPLKLFFKRPR